MKKFLLLLILISFTQISFATHNMAGDISYTHISGYTYKITVRMFNNTYATTTDRCEIIVYFGDGDSAAVSRTNGPSINCTSGHDGVMTGSICPANVKYSLYETTHTYAGDGAYTLTMNDPNRSFSLCNLTNSVNTSFHIQAELVINSFLGPNNGPSYVTIPVICDTIGTISYYDQAVIETDGDSLFYELVNPMSHGATLYWPAYTYPYTSNSFSINNSSGTITWDTPAQICKYIFDIKITEWRNIGGTYYTVGNSMQEIWSQTVPYTGIIENESNTSISVFPNPSNGFLNFTINNPLVNEAYHISIYNTLGQMIRSYDLSTNTSLSITETEFAPGIFYYSLRDQSKVLNSGKFLVSDASSK